MKKFMVLNMASGPEFEKMMKNSNPAAEERDGRLDEMDEREQGVHRRGRSALGKDQAR